MASTKHTDPQLTDDLDLGPGLVVTPGHAVAPKRQDEAPVFSDRRLAADGTPAQHPTLSTYEQGGAIGTAQPVPAPAYEPAPPASTESNG
jgi:hypothetical protein